MGLGWEHPATIIASAVKAARARFRPPEEQVTMTPHVTIPTGSVAIERPCLYVVATPIGNLADITLRALAVLEASDLILAEDTRTTGRLLAHYGLATRTQALHEHNEREASPGLVARMQAERLAVALVSDAGTPLLSDPGYPLTRAALAAGLAVRPIPGASAVLAALCVAGLPTDRFCFEGFLPPKAAAASARLAALASEPRTLVFFEAPRRVGQALATMAEVLGAERPACVARELTKLHETCYRGSLAQVAAAVAKDGYGERGEFVVVVGGAPQGEADAQEIGRVLGLLQPHLTRRTAVELTANFLGVPRNQVYALALDQAGPSPAD